MKQLLVVGILIFAISLGFISHMALAQEPVAPAAPAAATEEAADETEFSYGTVKSVTGNQLVVSEYDYDADKDIDVTYTVPPEAKLENVASVQEIAAGDIVDIDFVAKDGQKVVSLITVEKPTGQDEDLLLDEVAPDAGATN